MTDYGLHNQIHHVITIVVLGALSTITTILRFLARTLNEATFMMSDYLILGANVSRVNNSTACCFRD
jgi:hypothetical protein